MLSTKNLVSDVREVPESWIYSYYCNIPIEQFNGADFKIRSVFKTERTPSMSFYVRDEKYLFTDFSSGVKGGPVQLVQHLKDYTSPIPYYQACMKIVSDFNNWRLRSNGEVVSIKEFKRHSKYRVTEVGRRKWTKADATYWTAYNIGSKLLERYKVFPLEYYTMSKEERQLVVTGEHIYGYFKEGSELPYKIYQPKVEDLKFIKISDYIQGSEQIQGHPYLIYMSSLKDIMSIASFNLNVDLKAPDSENTLISEAVIRRDLENYKKVLVWFDNDLAGQRAAQKYKDRYGIEPMFLNYGEKDPSDHTKVLGPAKTKLLTILLINKKLNN